MLWACALLTSLRFSVSDISERRPGEYPVCLTMRSTLAYFSVALRDTILRMIEYE